MCWNKIKAGVAARKAEKQKRKREQRRKEVQQNALDDNRVLLSPMILSPDSDNRIDQYRYSLVDELRNAIDSRNCNNIAITGVYGSGKSSVIQTYLAEMPACFRATKVLTLSLANYLDKDIDKKKEHAYENTIENKLFQHILYKANEDRTVQSHYKKIANISKRRALRITLFGLLAVLCFFVVFFPHLLLSFKYISDAFEIVHSWRAYRFLHGIVYFIAIAYIVCALIQCVIYFIRRVRRVHIKGVEIRDWKVDFGKEPKTAFNELLDEILYFFRAGGYEIVIFEDLDRIYNPDRLFLKLREINLLLNESDYYKRRGMSIKFIYAIRDDLFESDIRVKCFDYIISVVPVVDKYNAGDYLIKHYGTTIMDSIDARDLGVIGMYIRGKRELSNIVNEYGMSFNAFIVDASSTTKLLAMLVYKNNYPKDYAKAYQKEGCLYAIFNAENKERIYAPVIADLLAKEKKISEAIQDSQQKIYAFRGAIVDVLANEGVTRFVYRGVDHSIDDLVDDDSLYGILMDNKFDSYYDANNTKHLYDKDYTELAAEAHPELADIDDYIGRCEEEYHKLMQQRNALRQETERLKNMGIGALLKAQDSKQALETIQSICAESYAAEALSGEQQKQHSELMLIFTKEGYIAEDYVTYMSLTYEGALSENDYTYINSVLQDIVLVERPTINNVSAVIQRLRGDDFQKNSILNNTMLDYLLQTKDEIRLKDVIGVARRNLEFVRDYVGISKYRTTFLQKLFDNWEGAITALKNIEDGELRKAMFLLYVECLPRDVELDESEINYMEDMYEFMSLNISSSLIAKFKRYLIRYKLKFNQLQDPTEQSQALFSYVIENGHFAVTIDNLRVIYGKEFENAAFTQIYKGNSKVLKYMHSDFDGLIPNIPETSTHEDPETIVKLINDKEVDIEGRLEYINRQEAKIDLKDVDEKYVETLVLRTNIVRPTWENVDQAYGLIKTENDKDLAQYVQRNMDMLTATKCATGNADALEKMLLLETDEFTVEEYGRIADCFMTQIGQAELKGNDVSEENMQVLINNGKFLFDKDTFEYIEEKYSTQILGAYVRANFARFVETKDIWPKDSNLLGIEILNSSLRLDEKRQYMEKYPFDEDGGNAEEYAKLYCFYYEKIGAFKEADMDALIAAMYMNHEDGSWFVKISIVNQINRTMEYNRDREARLLNTLGYPYDQLNHYGHHALKFDNNPENTELLWFLKDNHPYVSDVKSMMWNQWKVTFRHKGDE